MNEDARMLMLAGELGVGHRALAERLRRLVGSDNEAGMLSVIHEAEAVLELKDFNPNQPRDPHTGKWVDVSGDVRSGHDLRSGDRIRQFRQDLRGQNVAFTDLEVSHVRNGVAHVHKLRNGRREKPGRAPIAVPELSHDLPGYIANGHAKVFRRNGGS